MLSFEPLRLDQQALYKKYTSCERTSEGSFAAVYSWRHKNKLQLCEQDGFLFRLANMKAKSYLYPLGAEGILTGASLTRALNLIAEDAKAYRHPIIFQALNETGKANLEQVAPGRFSYAENREEADYLYRAADLTQLAGKSYHSKRNFIARFEREFADNWHYEDMSNDNLDAVWAFQEKWCRKNGCASNIDLQEEATCISLLLYNLDLLQAKGGVLWAGKQVVAFTVGSQIGSDTLDIHIEKADYEVAGAYPMINREFAKRHAVGPIQFINREEDLGLEGLRKSKLSYKPAEIAIKYTATEIQ